MSDSRKSRKAAIPDPASDGPRVLARWMPDRRSFWQRTFYMAVIFGFVAVWTLYLLDNPYLWTAPLAAFIAVFGRAAYLKSEILAQGWVMTETTLNGPQGRIVPLASVAEVKSFLGDVVIVTRAGEKHLIKYPADPEPVVRRIKAALP
ncbi:hypothetical protein [Pseudogemmobacter sonorensis]|uniref:hypothetical protein n=1 Tax=Pseudogemmobacter sonorensis TaxID=2989681 RepID=UPI00368990C7